MVWENDFRKRMDGFAASSDKNGIPLSIKIRVESGCFHREHSPEAYRMIDEQIRSLIHHGELCFEEHESGPELLVYAAFATAGASLAASIINLVVAIINARKKGIDKGDKPSAPLVLIVRGYGKKNNLKEETILTIPSSDSVNEKLISDVLNKAVQKWIE